MKRAALLLVLVAGCSSAQFDVAAVDPVDGSVSDDTGSASNDSSAADSSTSDDTSSQPDGSVDASMTDSGASDSNRVDIGTVDSGKVDSGKVDSGSPADTSIVDSGSPADTSIVDSGSPADTAVVDGGSPSDTRVAETSDGAACLSQPPATLPFLDDKSCEQLGMLYADALSRAKSCGCTNDCAVTACENFCCSCSVYVNPQSETYLWLEKIKSKAASKACIGICPLVVCVSPKGVQCVSAGASTASCVTSR